MIKRYARTNDCVTMATLQITNDYKYLTNVGMLLVICLRISTVYMTLPCIVMSVIVLRRIPLSMGPRRASR